MHHGTKAESPTGTKFSLEVAPTGPQPIDPSGAFRDAILDAGDNTQGNMPTVLGEHCHCHFDFRHSLSLAVMQTQLTCWFCVQGGVSLGCKVFVLIVGARTMQTQIEEILHDTNTMVN